MKRKASTRRHSPRRLLRHPWRSARASIRDTYLLLRQFGWPLLFFALAIIGGGLLFYWLALDSSQPVDGVVEAIYQVLAMTFLQPVGEFPDELVLQLFYFFMPIIGIGILAQGLADFGRLLFNRRARGKEWEMAVASTFRQHIVLIGLGHLGFRVAKALYELDQDVAVIELDPAADLVNAIREMDIPLIHDDGKRIEALKGAGVEHARAITVCTQNDNLNLQIAFKARKINPNIQVVVRIFDDDFAQAIEENFGFKAMSATGMAAPKFAASAVGVDITRPITIEGEALSLACLNINHHSDLVGCSVAEIEQSYEVSVVLLRRDHESDFHPAGERQLSASDFLGVLAGPEQISRLIGDNQ